MTTVFVIPCKFDADRPVIFECIEAIQRHHNDPKILVVDSDSDDTSYLDWCVDHGCLVADIHNRMYANGAFAYAVREYPNVEFFHLIFDSLILQRNCDEFQDRPLTVMRHWHSSQHDWGWDAQNQHLSIWGRRQLEDMGIPFTSDYHGIFGPMMFLDRTTCDQLDRIGYWDIQTTDGYLQCALERLAGVTLEFLGFDIPSVSLQGIHTHHEAHYDETYIAKRNLARS